MKKIILLFMLAFFFSSYVSAAEQNPAEPPVLPQNDIAGTYAAYLDGQPDISGQWHGLLAGHGVYRKIVLDVKKPGKVYAAAVTGLEDGSSETKVSSVVFEEYILRFKIVDHAVEYKGVYEEDGAIRGDFRWEGMDFKVKFSREEIRRPQEPLKKKNYTEEEVFFENKADGITLAGTLALPKDAEYMQNGCPAVVLISGSGPHDRNAAAYGHKPFAVIADYLADNGIASLRYDDRGTGASSGSFQAYTTEDFSRDAAAAAQYLKSRKEISGNNIGLAGHGEGAVIASMVAARTKEPAFIILLAGQGLPGGEIIIKKQEMTGKAAGVRKQLLKRDIAMNKKVIDIVTGSANVGQQRSEITEYAGKVYDGFKPSEIPKGMGKADFVRLYLNGFTSAWMRYFLKYNPAEDLQKVKCPVFAGGGGKDLQISSKDNLKEIKKALERGGNKNVTVKLYPKLNHMFQESKTGLPSEYEHIEQSFSAEVLEDIVKWIKKTGLKI
jgi:pimeloyl-ACP methyl ester carboxylesterase